MAFTLKNIFPNVSRHSNAARSAAEFVNAVMVYELSNAGAAGGAATATVTSKVKTANTITGTINGAYFTGIVAADPMWTLGVTGSNTLVAASRFQKYALLLDAAGTATVQEATQATTAAGVIWTNVSNLSPWAPFLTIVGSTKLVAATLTIATDATHTFTPGTTLLGATGITATFADGIDQSLLPLIASQTGVLLGLGG